MNLTKVLNQTAVYWGNPVPDGWGGFSYDSPVEVAVRWTDKQERFVPATGGTPGAYEEKLSRAVLLAETDFDLNGRMLLGTLTGLTSDMLANSNDALTIEAFAKIPDKTAQQFLRKVWLV